MRKPREDAEGAVHHVYAHACHGEQLFRDDEERRMYVTMLGTAAARWDWRVLTFCLMGNHVHALVETPRGGLAAGMQWLHGAFASWCNRRRGRRGHLFMSRYGATRMRSTGQLRRTVQYIAANPVEAGFCAAPEDWPWTAPLRLAPAWLATDRLHWYLADLGGDAAEGYADAVAHPAAATLSGSGASAP